MKNLFSFEPFSFELSFFKPSFLKHFVFLWGLMKNLFSFKPPLLNPLFLGGFLF